MKFAYVFFASVIFIITTLNSYPNAPIKLEDLRKTVAQEAALILNKQDINVKNLPQKFSVELQKKIANVTTQLINHLNVQRKKDVSLDVIHKDLEAALNTFTQTALTVISKKNISQAIDTCVTQLAQEKNITFDKLPPKMKTECEKRKGCIVSTLIEKMKTDNRDYVYVCDLENLCHEKFDLFLERAKYVLISQWGQAAMSALDSLKYATNTQPFPLQKEGIKTPVI
jgi:hypothetical protein